MCNKVYDVFVSYNSKDSMWATQLDEDLTELGLNVWIDVRALIPGRRWQDDLARGLLKAGSMAFLIGPSGIGPWHKHELELALSEYTAKGRSVVPVLLPGADRRKVPRFLSLYNWVDCRERISQRCIEQLVRGIIGKDIIRSVSQIGEEFSLHLRKPVRHRKIIKVGTLPNPNPDRLLYLTWETFGRGIEILKTQIQNWGQRLPVDACFGINEAGLVIATFLSSAILDRVKLGYVKCEGTQKGTRILADSLFPRLPQKANILLCDFEVKRTNVLKIVIEKLKGHYKKHKLCFFFAVFGAMTDAPNLKINGYRRLVSAKNLAILDIEDIFIACTMHDPGIEPPLELR